MPAQRPIGQNSVEMMLVFASLSRLGLLTSMNCRVCHVCRSCCYLPLLAISDVSMDVMFDVDVPR